MIRIKICGLTNVTDAVAADRAGADALGLIFAPSPRQIDVATAQTIDRAISPWVTRVGVFVDAEISEIQAITDIVRLDVLQLHGKETPDFVKQMQRRGFRVIKSIRVQNTESLAALDDYETDGFLLDTYVPGQAGGTGKIFDWSLAIEAARQYPVVLAGGLVPGNVAEAIRLVRPYGVDVSSGVEVEPGIKNHEAMEQFIERARNANGDESE